MKQHKKGSYKCFSSDLHKLSNAFPEFYDIMRKIPFHNGNLFRKDETMTRIKEIKAKSMNVEKFIAGKVLDIQHAVGDGLAINALSGGVDSSVVTVLGHRALGRNLKTYFIDNGIMRDGEPARVAAAFKKMGIHVE